jgi:hypothetical protein
MQVVIHLLDINDSESFCSIHRNRWCPEKDRCLPEVAKEEKVNLFLNDTDQYIKELYEFIEPDAPKHVGLEKQSKL